MSKPKFPAARKGFTGSRDKRPRAAAWPHPTQGPGPAYGRGRPRRPQPADRRPDFEGRPAPGTEGREAGRAKAGWQERREGRQRHERFEPPESAGPERFEPRAGARHWGPPGAPDRSGGRRGATGGSAILPRRPGTTYLYGVNPVQRALAVGKRKFYRLWLREGRLSDALSALQSAAEARRLPVGIASVEALTAHAGNDSHQGAVLECGALPLGDEADALNLLGPEGQPPGASADAAQAPAWPLLVILDQVEDPQNFGAIVRSCVAFGAAGVVVPRHHAAPPSAAASKASAGELEACPIFEAANLSRFLEACKTRGAWTVAAVTQGGQPLASFTRDSAIALVVGNEGRGLRPLVERHCDFRVTIPVSPGTSLNVAAATAVVLYALTGAR